MVRPTLHFFTILSLSVLLSLSGCSTKGRSDRENLRTLVASQNWTAALKLIETSDFYKEENSKLLGLLERGAIKHYQGHYFQSIQILNQARDLSRELYTRSVSAQAKTLVANDNFDDYFGAPYERSMIHYYLGLNHFLLYQTGVKEEMQVAEQVIPAETLSPQERQQSLLSARAEMLAWDGLLKMFVNSREGAVYKEDLLGRVLAGLIHEAIGTRDELQISLQLYKDGLGILTKYYGAYPSFNQQYKKFVSDYKKLPTLSKDKLQAEYLQTTENYQATEIYLKRKVLQLTQQLYPKDLPTVRKQLDLTLEEQKQILGNINGASNIVLVLNEGLVPVVEPATQYFGLDYAQYDSEAARVMAAVGSVALGLFAANTLGLQPAPQNWNPVGAQLGLEVATTMARGLAISFELPVVRPSPPPSLAELVITTEATKEEQRLKLPLAQVIGDISRQAIAEDSVSRYGRVGLRVIMKHLTAIVASYGTYKLLAKEDDATSKFLARNAAVIQYLAASRGIAATERADTRHWSSLPQAVRLIDLHLPPGEYSLRLESSGRVIHLDKLVVPESQSGKMLHLSHLNGIES